MNIGERYISTDVEADGPIPGVYSMLSFGSAAYRVDKTLVSTFGANLETLPDAKQGPSTMEFWSKNKVAWDAHREDLETPQAAMTRYLAWLKTLPMQGHLVFVSYPVAYDFLFVYWYLMKFCGESPFSHSACDIKTYAMALLGRRYKDSTKRNMPKEWFDNLPHTHRALDDAIEQGALFCNMMSERNKLINVH